MSNYKAVFNFIQSEVTYALLYCLYLKEVCEESTVKEFDGPQTDVAFCWLALDMSRWDQFCSHHYILITPLSVVNRHNSSYYYLKMVIPVTCIVGHSESWLALHFQQMVGVLSNSLQVNQTFICCSNTTRLRDLHFNSCSKFPQSTDFHGISLYYVCIIKWQNEFTDRPSLTYL